MERGRESLGNPYCQCDGDNENRTLVAFEKSLHFHIFLESRDRRSLVVDDHAFDARSAQSPALCKF